MDTTPLDTFAASLQRRVYQLVRECELCDQICMGQYGVTASQGYTVLAMPESESVTMNALSEAMGLANSTMTRMVDQLVSKKLVYRSSDDEDRRVVRVGLTAQGQETRRNLEQVQQFFFGQVLAEIPQNEQPVILQILERIVAAVGKVRQSSCNV